DEIGVPAKGEDFLAGRQLPEFYGLVEAGGREVLAVGAEGDAGDAHAVGLEVVGELAGRRVIDLHDSCRAVVYVGQEPAVGAEVHAPGAAHEDGLQGGKSLSARRHVSNNDLAIPARRG